MRRYSSFLIATFGGLFLWILSPLIFGLSEPWDASPVFYFASLFVLGIFCGLVSETAFLPAWLGAFVGQAAFLVYLTFRPDYSAQGLEILGLFFAAFYSVLAGLGTLVASIFKRVQNREQ